ncbi:type II toxin-antitoxin system HicB family antitoxin [Tissierella carlieri]|uniref:Type II toxin-antitoxin system HicB family antitoxin n=1 Tax=Tissierella carlieri TaxID=689904 RepID=A0ABT1SEP8_9FIRM|nr:type II toxin-antitoxin system HicB family antitoxin [Tissierella carlieri]MCQ4924958.1 type II toxin-antitoxin system HicB family antitoxin [Tissierella carlieri]
MKKVYPIILTPGEYGYTVTVPDLEINTQGTDVIDAIDMARDAIGLWGITEEDLGRKIPEPKTISMDLIAHYSDEIVTLIDIDFIDYRKAIDRKTVRKNVTLPSWLNEAAEKEGINFSQVLQEALKEKLKLNNA